MLKIFSLCSVIRNCNKRTHRVGRNCNRKTSTVMCHLGSVKRFKRTIAIQSLQLPWISHCFSLPRWYKEFQQLLKMVNYIDDVVSCFSKAFVILIPVAMSDFLNDSSCVG